MVEVDRLELTDKRLNVEENNARLREEILKQETAKRIHGQDELEKVERSRGTRLYFTEVLRRLRNINPNLRVLEGSAGSVALYAPKSREEFEPSDFENVPPGGPFFIHHKYVGGMFKDWLPEWGHVTVDTSLVAHHEVRGWRSVLIQLVKTKVISYQDAVEAFGDPFFDSRSQFWFEQLSKFRN